MPSLIRPSYRFVTTYVFSDIRFLKVPRSEEKRTIRWFYGFKLHFIINDQGALSQSK
nr:transposase [Candidatus Enterovibrio escacola]